MTATRYSHRKIALDALRRRGLYCVRNAPRRRDGRDILQRSTGRFVGRFEYWTDGTVVVYLQR